MPGTGLGKTGMVGVGEAGGLVAVAGTWAARVIAGSSVDWARRASRLDIKPVKAT
jgi:hypothetical protein